MRCPSSSIHLKAASSVSLSVTPHHSRRSCCFSLTFASVRSLPPSRSWRSRLRSVSTAVVASAHVLGLRHPPARVLYYPVVGLKGRGEENVVLTDHRLH